MSLPKWGRMCDWTPHDDAMLLLGIYWSVLFSLRNLPVSLMMPHLLVSRWNALDLLITGNDVSTEALTRPALVTSITCSSIGSCASQRVLWELKRAPDCGRHGFGHWDQLAGDTRLGLGSKLEAAATEKRSKNYEAPEDHKVLPKGALSTNGRNSSSWVIANKFMYPSEPLHLTIESIPMITVLLLNVLLVYGLPRILE